MKFITMNPTVVVSFLTIYNIINIRREVKNFFLYLLFSIIQNHVGQGQQKGQERKELNSCFDCRNVSHCVSHLPL